MRWVVVPLCTLIAACGDDDTIPIPPEISAGPVTITTDPLSITVDGGLDATVAVGTVANVDGTRYYDPRDLTLATWHRPTRVTAATADGWLVLDGGMRIRLSEGTDEAHSVFEFDAAAVDNAIHAQLAVTRSTEEPIYGFGESFGGANAVGQVREMQFRADFDYESSLNEAHVPVPLALWPRRAAGVFVADRRPGAFDVGATDAGIVAGTFILPERGPYAAHVFVAPPDAPSDLVRRYVSLTARPAVPPRWAFAPQQWRNVHDSSDQVREDADEMRTRGIPGSTIWIDNPWQTGYNTFVFDETRFVEPAQLIADLTALGYRVLVWSTPYVNQSGITADDFQFGAANDFFVQDDAGGILVFPWQNGPGALLDFTRDGVTAWWRERIRRATDLGIDGFKLDFGEDVVPELAGNLIPLMLAAGDSQENHGIYQRGYHDAYLGALPDGDGFVITRAGAWGEQDRNTTIWPGDLDRDFSRHGGRDGEDGMINVGGLPAAIAGGTSLAVSGYPFYGSDIGGFRGGIPDTETLIRWSQYAALGTIMQLGGGGESHNPWDTALYDPPALDVYLEYSRLHMDLNPYLWTLALRAGADGTPTTPPAAFVHDCACDDAMFMLGDAILVAPVIEPGATTRDVVLPAGEWIDWATGTRATGDGTTSATVPAPLATMPFWRRAGAMVPMFARAADTMEPATTAGVTSYVDPAYGGELAVRFSPEPAAIAMAAIHDGATAGARPGATGYDVDFTPGTEYAWITFDIDTRATTIAELVAPATITVTAPGTATLPEVVTTNALETCPSPGCWLAEPGRLRVRADAATAVSITIED
jgi:alpha-D-xyloside xylohydrolase